MVEWSGKIGSYNYNIGVKDGWVDAVYKIKMPDRSSGKIYKAIWVGEDINSALDILADDFSKDCVCGLGGVLPGSFSGDHRDLTREEFSYFQNKVLESHALKMKAHDLSQRRA